MSDEIDRHLDALRARPDEWKSAYQIDPKGNAHYRAAGNRHTVSRSVELFEGPFPDLLRDFCRRAIQAGLGSKYALVKGPDGLRYAAAVIDPGEWRVEMKFTGGSPGPFLNLRMGRREREVRRDIAGQAARANRNLARDGIPATALRLYTGSTEGEGHPPYFTCFATTDAAYCHSSDRGTPWGTRDEFARACASTLHHRSA